MSNRIGGITHLSINGVRYALKGVAEYKIGVNERSTVTGMDGVHGYSEKPSAAMAKVTITDRGDLDVRELQEVDNATIALELANGKTVMLYEAWQAGDNGITPEEGEISCQFDAKRGEEIAA